jgi:hypothetical protein
MVMKLLPKRKEEGIEFRKQGGFLLLSRIVEKDGEGSQDVRLDLFRNS